MTIVNNEAISVYRQQYDAMEWKAVRTVAESWELPVMPHGITHNNNDDDNNHSR